MTHREKGLIGLVALVLVSAVIAYKQYKNKLETFSLSRNTVFSTSKSTTPNGSVDNAVNQLYQDMSTEDSLAGQVEQDSSLLSSDSQAINSFNQVYAESEF